MVLKHIFGGMPFTSEETDRIVSSFKSVTYQKNDFIIKSGQTAFKYGFIEQGVIRSFVLDKNGNEICTSFYTKGEVAIDWQSFINKIPTPESMQTLTECVCWEIDFDRFQFLFNSIENFRESGRGRLVNSYFKLKKRSISLITDSAKERYIHLLHEKPDLFRHVSLKYIATYLGITDTSLSRIRKEVSSGL